jgi:two-component system, response regulator PdtaR
MQPDRTIWTSESIPSAPPIATPIKVVIASPTERPVSYLRIMIVEDDALIGMLLGDMLEILGHEVCAIVATENAAVAAALSFRPTMMIVDAYLREGSGIGAVDRITANGFVSHVFVTGDVRSVQRLRPCSIVIAKPFNEDELAHALVQATKRN